MQQKELAIILGISPAMVSRLAKRGMPTDTPERAERWRRRHLEPGRVKGNRADTGQRAEPAPKLEQPASPPRQSPAEGDEGAAENEGFIAARTRREIAEANKAEMEQAEMQGKYLNKADFERHLFTAGRMLRDNLINCSRRIGAEVAGTTNPDECEAIIYREHRAALASFAQALRMSLGVAMADPSA